jgi:hypothetical protein
MRNQQLKEATAFPGCEEKKVQLRSLEKGNQEVSLNEVRLEDSKEMIIQFTQGRSGIDYIDNGFVYAWSPPNSNKYVSKPMNFAMENDMCPPVPEAEEPNVRNTNS